MGYICGGSIGQFEPSEPLRWCCWTKSGPQRCAPPGPWCCSQPLHSNTFHGQWEVLEVSSPEFLWSSPHSGRDCSFCTTGPYANLCPVLGFIVVSGMAHHKTCHRGWCTVVGRHGEEQWAEHTPLWGPSAQCDGLLRPHCMKVQIPVTERFWLPSVWVSLLAAGGGSSVLVCCTVVLLSWYHETGSGWLWLLLLLQCSLGGKLVLLDGFCGWFSSQTNSYFVRQVFFHKLTIKMTNDQLWLCLL